MAATKPVTALEPSEDDLFFGVSRVYFNAVPGTALRYDGTKFFDDRSPLSCAAVLERAQPLASLGPDYGTVYNMFSFSPSVRTRRNFPGFVW
jgi:hypothetical protein